MNGRKRKPITGYEGLYEVTESGRIYSVKRNKYMSRCNDEYGFHIVKLSKDGKGKNHKVFDLWKKEFNDVGGSLFKGTLKVKNK